LLDEQFFLAFLLTGKTLEAFGVASIAGDNVSIFLNVRKKGRMECRIVRFDFGVWTSVLDTSLNNSIRPPLKPEIFQRVTRDAHKILQSLSPVN
jgi:hypothetical protein